MTTKVSRSRHRLEVEFDLAIDDQSDPETIIDVLTHWFIKCIAQDEKEFDVRWPEDFRIKHLGESVVEVEIEETPNSNG